MKENHRFPPWKQRNTSLFSEINRHKPYEIKSKSIYERHSKHLKWELKNRDHFLKILFPSSPTDGAGTENPIILILPEE